MSAKKSLWPIPFGTLQLGIDDELGRKVLYYACNEVDFDFVIAPKGEMGLYIVTHGGTKSWSKSVKSPAFMFLQCFEFFKQRFFTFRFEIVRGLALNLIGNSTQGENMNPWHEIDINLDEENELNCLIEIPMGSKIKYELDKKSGLLLVDRILYSSVHYPCNYGFFPKSYCDDGDPLDVLVFGQLPVVPLSIMRVRPVGVIRMKDQGKFDDKVLSIHVHDPEFNHIRSISDMAKHKLIEVRQFFESYKALEKKKVEIAGVFDEAEAMKIIHEALDLYKKSKFNY